MIQCNIIYFWANEQIQFKKLSQLSTFWIKLNMLWSYIVCYCLIVFICFPLLHMLLAAFNLHLYLFFYYLRQTCKYVGEGCLFSKVSNRFCCKRKFWVYSIWAGTLWLHSKLFFIYLFSVGICTFFVFTSFSATFNRLCCYFVVVTRSIFNLLCTENISMAERT